MISTLETIASKTGADKVVHSVTGGKRVANKDGTYNNEMVEHVAHETGFDKIVHSVTGGKRVLNKDGSYNPELVDEIKKQVTEVMLKGMKAEVEKMKKKLDYFMKNIKKALEVVETETSKLLKDCKEPRKQQKALAHICSKAQKLLPDMKWLPMEALSIGITVGAGASCGISAGFAYTLMMSINSKTIGIADNVATSVGVGPKGELAASIGLVFSTAKAKNQGGPGYFIEAGVAAGYGMNVNVGFALCPSNTEQPWKLGSIAVTFSAGGGAGVAIGASYCWVLKEKEETLNGEKVKDE